MFCFGVVPARKRAASSSSTLSSVELPPPRIEVKETTRSRLLRAVTEFVVIVVGVLVALQFEEWRDEREAQSRGRAAVVALRADLAETLARIEGDIRRQNRTLEAQRQLLQLSEGSADLPPPDSMAALVTRAIMYQRLEPVTGSYDALVNAGDLRIIPDSELRSELAALFAVMGEGYEDEGLSMALRMQMIAALANTSDALAVTGSALRGPLGLPPGGRTAEYRALLDDPSYITMLMMVMLAEKYQLDYFVDLRDRIVRLLESLEDAS